MYKMKKIMAVFGTKPEAIKMCPLVRELRRRARCATVVCYTGQHRDMSRDVLETFGVMPDCDLSVMKERQTLFDITGDVLARIRPVLEAEAPDIVLVHGDTTTAFSAALAAFYLGIPIGHIEAGLRTHRLDSPYPEEFNRRTVGTLSTLDFAPTETARRELIAEGKDPARIFVTGNTSIDALNFTLRKDYSHPLLDWAGSNRLVIVTAHRRESAGEPMRGMLRAIRRVTDEHRDVRVIFPVHPNPDVAAIAGEILGGDPSVRLTAPIGVSDFHNLLSRSYLLLTDSGGIEEEATALGKPTLVMRDVTERPEGIAAGVLRLVGTDEEGVYGAFSSMLDDSAEYRLAARASKIYGDGHASERIADILEGFLL